MEAKKKGTLSFNGRGWTLHWFDNWPVQGDGLGGGTILDKELAERTVQLEADIKATNTYPCFTLKQWGYQGMQTGDLLGTILITIHNDEDGWVTKFANEMQKLGYKVK